MRAVRPVCFYLYFAGVGCVNRYITGKRQRRVTANRRQCVIGFVNANGNGTRNTNTRPVTAATAKPG